jgi:8-oxo-dGTP diphosphatase
METTRIGIAIVEDEGRYLVGVRQANQVLAGKAEFPGGKCEPGETAGDCAVRECFEETGVPVVAVRLLDQIEHEYPHARLALEFWLCRVDAGSREHAAGAALPRNGFRWIERANLATLGFPDANVRVVDGLVSELW